jgi:hypothetical protein
MATKEQNEAWLAECEIALQTVLMGNKAQAVGYGGNSVTYTPADAGKLRQRIQELKRDLGLSRPRATRPHY